MTGTCMIRNCQRSAAPGQVVCAEHLRLLTWAADRHE
jgi:hypothetical protein